MLETCSERPPPDATAGNPLVTKIAGDNEALIINRLHRPRQTASSGPTLLAR
jgi:hypothetical protein